MTVRAILFISLSWICGCIVPVESQPVSTTAHPPIRVTRNGIMFHDKYVVPDDVPKLLEKHGYSKTKTVHILVDDDYDDNRALWVLKHNYIDRAGYAKSVWVHARRGISGLSGNVQDHDGVTIPYNEGPRRIIRK